MDSSKRIYAVYAGIPNDDGYETNAEDLYHELERCRQEATFLPGEVDHRRGLFPAVNFGISQGNGKGPASRLKTGHHGVLINSLLRSERLNFRIANFPDGVFLSCSLSISQMGLAAFQAWAPRLHSYYSRIINKLEERVGACRNFPGSVFACATANFGLAICSYKHRTSSTSPMAGVPSPPLGISMQSWAGILYFGKLKRSLNFLLGRHFSFRLLVLLTPTPRLERANIGRLLLNVRPAGFSVGSRTIL